MIKFEPVTKYKNANLTLPCRSTECSAGYDLAAAEDVLIPPFDMQSGNIMSFLKDLKFDSIRYYMEQPFSLSDMAEITKHAHARPTLVSTGMKCYLDKDKYLELSVRSSTPYKHWLLLANGVGIIDADYADNESNEGEIFLQIINLSPYAIQIKKGEKIGQGIIKKYCLTDDDCAGGARTGGLGSTGQ